MNRRVIIILTIIGIAAVAVFYRFVGINKLAQIEQPVTEETQEQNLLPISPDRTPYPESELQAIAYTNFLNLFGDRARTNPVLVEPVEGFKERITKKPFGLYITPETSPVSPDKFTGYHTGVDSEFTDTGKEVPVRAIADGTIVVRTWASGYGGVIAIRHIINGVPLFAVYGHLDPKSFLAADITEVKAGQQIAVLGDNHSDETDGARKHLHFSIYSGEKLDLHGYVQTKEELAPWLNPLDLY